MNREDIKSKVIAVIADHYGHDAGDLSENTQYVADLDADSLDRVEEVVYLETDFECDFPETLFNCTNIRETIDLIHSELNN